jgi:hypothetical protein
MMQRKTLSVWAVVILIMVISTVILYPRIFNPDRHPIEKAPSRLNEPVIPAPPPPTVPPIKSDEQ